MMKVQDVSTALIDEVVIEVGWDKALEIPDSAIRAMLRSEWLTKLAFETIPMSPESLSDRQLFVLLLGALGSGMKIGMRIAEKLEPSGQAAERKVQ